MKPLELVFAAAAGLATITSGAQAQEYQSQRTVTAPGFRQTTYEDGSTTTTTWHVNNATGEITDENTVRTHATPSLPAATPVPAATNQSHAAHTVLTPQPRVETVQAPVVVTSMTKAEMQAESDAGAARVKAETEAEAKAKAAKDKANVKSSKRKEVRDRE